MFSESERGPVRSIARNFYNPDWLDDDQLVAGFVARRELFEFLRHELERAPLRGGVQHYVLVGARGAGKTTLLKRLAVSIRRDDKLKDHLIALSFPEELYQVKGLADFWWAACEALGDALERTGQREAADRLNAAIDEHRPRGAQQDAHDEAGLAILLRACSEQQRRPVMLVDNLDLVLQRIDKTGRKLNDPHASSYWALREALSTSTAPIVIGGSVRLTEPFLGYDKAFYDFFIPKRLGKLSLSDMREVLENLARAYGAVEVTDRMRARPGRIRALYELTGGNPRALGLIFELLRQGPNSRAIDDLERLLDITTPYYKARLEELSEQAQVVMHSLALCRRRVTAADIAQQAGLETRTVSSQLEMLANEGIVEKVPGRGRTRYIIAEQLFRLWLQMRTTRRIRQRVLNLAEYLELLFDREELEELIRAEREAEQDSSLLSRAQVAFALGEWQGRSAVMRAMKAKAAELALKHSVTDGSTFEDYFKPGDLPTDIETIAKCRQDIQSHLSRLTSIASDAPVLMRSLLGSISLDPKEKRESVARLCDASQAQQEVERLRPLLAAERNQLHGEGLTNAEIALLYDTRSHGLFPLPQLTVEDVNAAVLTLNRAEVRQLAWKLLCAERLGVASEAEANRWVKFGMSYASNASSADWVRVASAMRRGGFLAAAAKSLDKAFTLGESSRAWFERGSLLWATNGDARAEEAAHRKAIELDPFYAAPWYGLGRVLGDRLGQYEEARAAFSKAIELNPSNSGAWYSLGRVLSDRLRRYREAQAAFSKAIELDPSHVEPWIGLGRIDVREARYEAAEAAFRKAIEIDPSRAAAWVMLASLMTRLRRYDEAEDAFRKAIAIDPSRTVTWVNLGWLMMRQNRHQEAEAKFRTAIDVDPSSPDPWAALGWLLSRRRDRPEDAASALREAIRLDPSNASLWEQLGTVLGHQLALYKEAEGAYRRAIHLNPLSAECWTALGHLLATRLGRFDEAEEAYSTALELQPRSREASIRLATLIAKRSLADVAKAVDEGDWHRVRDGLDRLMKDREDELNRNLLVDEGMVEGIIGLALRHGAGDRMLSLLRETGIEKLALPLVLAMEAVVAGNTEGLANAEPEARSAAEMLYARLCAFRNYRH